MQIRFAETRPTGDYALVLPVAGKDRSSLASLGPAQQGVTSALDRQRFEGDAASASEHFVNDGEGVRRVLVVGTGTGEPGPSAEKLGGTAVARLLTSGEKKAVIDLSGRGFDADTAARVGLAAALRSWRYDRYRTKLKDNQKPTLQEVVIVGGGQGAGDAYTKRWAPVVEGVSLTRELVTEPANIIYPESFVERVTKSLEGSGIELEVLDRKAMEKLGMGALLGVAQGSVREARMLILKWNGGAKGGQPVAFVGKGVTFDTGGISLKPADGMEKMKYDMAGGATAMAALRTLALFRAPLNCMVVVPLVENMPGGRAQRPGDVVRAMSGKTIEIINTDAEGRLILADALAYAIQLGATHLVDLATLTGAVRVALGSIRVGVLGNQQPFIDRLLKAAERTGERMWQLPMDDEYREMIKSSVADVANSGGRFAGTITAAKFLEEFVGNLPWVHLDIAGTAWNDEEKPYLPKGPSGVAVRTLVELALGFSQE